MNVTRQKLQQIFKVYEDKKNSTPNTIKTSEIAKLIRSARLFPTEEQIIELEKRVDPMKQGIFSMQKFVQIGLHFAQKQSHINHEQELLKAFSFFDQQQNEYVTQADLKKIMNAFGEPLSEEETKQILKYAKVTNGQIYYKDFVRTIISGKIQ